MIKLASASHIRLVTDGTMQAHAAADIFPMMSAAEFDALVADIRENGQREPIVVTDGMILDGRNRAKACEQIGIVPRTLQWDRKGTPEAFVVSMNLHRRHLNESQRGMIAAKLATRTREETLIPNAAGRGKLDDDIPPSSMSAGQAATLLNISRDTVNAAKKVLRDGTPEDIAAVHRGQAGVNTIVRKMRDEKRDAPKVRKAKRDAPPSTIGKNPERIQRMQMQAEIWALLGGALEALTALPLPADVAEIINANTSRRKAVDERLDRALAWLKGFADACIRD